MRLPGERFGSLFTRFRYDSPFHFISAIGGLELRVRANKNNMSVYGTSVSSNFPVYRRLNDLIDDLRQLSTSKMYQQLVSIDEIIIDDDIIDNEHDIATATHAENNDTDNDNENDYQTIIIDVPDKNVNFIVEFIISYPNLNYIHDINGRRFCFEYLHRYITENKESYRFDSISRIVDVDDNYIQRAKPEHNTKSMFWLVFNTLESIREFIEFRLIITDSYQTLYYEYIPTVLNKSKILLESAVYIIVSSTLEMMLQLLVDTNGTGTYQIRIAYTRLSLIEDCINDILQFARAFDSSTVEYGVDPELKYVVICGVDCALKEQKQGYMTTYRNSIRSSFLTVIQNIIYTYEVKSLDDVD